MAAKKDPKKGKTKQPDPPAAPARTTKPSLSRASSDGPDPSLKAAKASEGKKKGPKKGVLDVQPGEKVVRVVDQSEEQAVGLGVDEAAVEGQGRGKSRKAKVAAGGTGVVDGLVETAGTRGNQRDDLLNELDADDQPVKSALKAPTTKSNKPGKKQEKAESSVSAKGKGKSPLVAAPARSSKSAAKTGKADVEATKGDDAFLAGFDSDEFSDEDSSDDEAEEPTPVDVKDLPKVTKQAKDTEKSKKKTEVRLVNGSSNSVDLEASSSIRRSLSGASYTSVIFRTVSTRLNCRPTSPNSVPSGGCASPGPNAPAARKATLSSSSSTSKSRKSSSKRWTATF